MYTPSNTFTTEMLTVFISRIKTILNKLYLKEVDSYDGETFLFRSGGSFNFIAFKKSPENAIIMWAENADKGISEIKVTIESFANLMVGDNLATFTQHEQQLVAELIEKEKESTSEIETHIKNIFNSEPLGKEFEQVLEENMDKLYER